MARHETAAKTAPLLLGRGDQAGVAVEKVGRDSIFGLLVAAGLQLGEIAQALDQEGRRYVRRRTTEPMSLRTLASRPISSSEAAERCVVVTRA